MTKGIFFALWVCAVLLVAARAGTLATFTTSIGRIELEFFDEDKPVTVSNFIAYVQSGRFEDLFIQRWVTNFVIQAGGFYVGTNASGAPAIRSVTPFPAITNEYSVGRTYSNLYGTIAMARRGGETNSATSQWFLNVADNQFLDSVDGGFTVFGRVTSGTNVLNRFVPPTGTQGIWQLNLDNGALSTIPVLTNQQVSFEHLIYVAIALRRDLNLKISNGRLGRNLSWATVPRMSNIVEYSTNLVNWQILTNVPGTGTEALMGDSSTDPQRFYRVKLLY